MINENNRDGVSRYYSLLDLHKALPLPDQIISTGSGSSFPRLSFRTSCLSDREARQDGQVDVSLDTSPSDKPLPTRADLLWERTILRKSSLFIAQQAEPQRV